LRLPPTDRDSWKTYGACRDLDTNLFFPLSKPEYEQPKRVCLSCPVRTQCRDFAVAIPNLAGVWGATSEKEREAIRRRRRRDRGGYR